MKKIPTEVYSRVVGYYRPINQWNKGKQSEFADRKEYSVRYRIDLDTSELVLDNEGELVKFEDIKGMLAEAFEMGRESMNFLSAN